MTMKILNRLRNNINDIIDTNEDEHDPNLLNDTEKVAQLKRKYTHFITYFLLIFEPF